jgi:hypothetical protein
MASGVPLLRVRVPGRQEEQDARAGAGPIWFWSSRPRRRDLADVRTALASLRTPPLPLPDWREAARLVHGERRRDEEQQEREQPMEGRRRVPQGARTRRRRRGACGVGEAGERLQVGKEENRREQGERRRTNRPTGSIVRYAPRTSSTSSLSRPAAASARNASTAPSQPTGAVTCAVSSSWRNRGGIG